MGYDVEILVQDNSKCSPDGIAKSQQNIDNTVQMLFNNKNLHLEAETTTLKRPEHIIRKFENSIADENYCVFLVESGKKNDVLYYAKLIDIILTSHINDIGLNKEYIDNWCCIIVSGDEQYEPIIYKMKNPTYYNNNK